MLGELERFGEDAAVAYCKIYPDWPRVIRENREKHLDNWRWGASPEHKTETVPSGASK